MAGKRKPSGAPAGAQRRKGYADGGLLQMPDSPRFASGPQISSNSIGQGVTAGANFASNAISAYRGAKADADKAAKKTPSSDPASGDPTQQGLYSRGGKIKHTAGKPIGRDDGLIPAQRGEFVVRKSAVNKLGTKVLNQVNKGKLPSSRSR